MIISRAIFLRKRNVLDKNFRENQNIYFKFNTFSPENRAVYEIMWKNRIQPDRQGIITQYGACTLHAG